jgi:hypothetical protein
VGSAAESTVQNENPLASAIQSSGQKTEATGSALKPGGFGPRNQWQKNRSQWIQPSKPVDSVAGTTGKNSNPMDSAPQALASRIATSPANLERLGAGVGTKPGASGTNATPPDQTASGSSPFDCREAILYLLEKVVQQP